MLKANPYAVLKDLNTQKSFWMHIFFFIIIFLSLHNFNEKKAAGPYESIQAKEMLHILE